MPSAGKPPLVTACPPEARLGEDPAFAGGYGGQDVFLFPALDARYRMMLGQPRSAKGATPIGATVVEPLATVVGPRRHLVDPGPQRRQRVGAEHVGEEPSLVLEVGDRGVVDRIEDPRPCAHGAW